eukprot:SAG31_NODE_20_length_34168_cov_33.651296_22_plen_127_part_00
MSDLGCELHTNPFLINSVCAWCSSIKFYYEQVENSVLTLPDGIADEPGLVAADRLSCFIMMSIWGAFVAIYIGVFIYSRNQKLEELNNTSEKEMKDAAGEPIQSEEEKVVAWNSDFTKCSEGKLTP